MLLPARSECGNDRGLDVGKHGVDCPECGVASCLASRSRNDRLMRASSVRDAVEGAVAVGDDVRVRRHDTLCDRLDRLLGEPLDAPKFHAAGLAVGRCLDSGDKRRLAGAAAATLATRARAAKIGVVHFHPAYERLEHFALKHDLSEFVMQLPGGIVADIDAPREFERGDALLGLRQVEHGAEPDGEIKLGPREDRARRQRSLRVAAIALPE